MNGTSGADRPSVLCVDDDDQVLHAMRRNLAKRFAVTTASNAADGLAWLASHRDAAVVVSDLRMPVTDGIAFLARAREIAPDAVRILLTGYADLETSIDAVNRGNIFRLLCKPCPADRFLGALTDANAEHLRLTATATPALMAARARVAFVENTDLLTHLPNRALLHERLRATEGAAVVCVEVETDAVADEYGQAGYEALVEETARRLRVAVRSRDSVARLEAGRFAVVTTGDLPVVRALAATLHDVATAPCEVRGRTIAPVAHVGIAKATSASDDDAIGNAEAALRRGRRRHLAIVSFDDR